MYLPEAVTRMRTILNAEQRRQAAHGDDGCARTTANLIDTIGTLSLIACDPLDRFPEDYLNEAFSAHPPAWARDPFNDDAAARCGCCNAWEMVVRPGKTQCDICNGGQNRDILAGLAIRRMAGRILQQ